MSKSSKKARNVVTLSGGALVAASPFIASGTAHAATFTVTNLLDNAVTPDEGSLRWAIEQADLTPATSDTITFAAGVTGTITLTAALYINSPMDIQGPGAGIITIDADGGDHPALYTRDQTQQAEIAISGLKLTGSAETVYGGGLTGWGDDVTLTDMVITGNTGAAAGGVYFDGTYDGDTGTLIISYSDISGNTGSDYAGAVYLDGGGDPVGSVPSLIIEHSTMSGNDGGGYGGALYVERVPLPGAVIISNSTISGNTAKYGGGGIYVASSALGITIVNSTITGNSADGSFGGGLYLGDVNNTATITNSVIAGNSAASGGDDIFTDGAAVVTANYSLIGEVEGTTLTGANNLTGDPMLGALAANGGIGKTHLPQAGSPLIDAGDPAYAGPLTHDQPGGARVYNSRIDIGAVEVQPAALPPTGGSNGLMATLGAGLLALGGALHLSGRRKRTA